MKEWIWYIQEMAKNKIKYGKEDIRKYLIRDEKEKVKDKNENREYRE